MGLFEWLIVIELAPVALYHLVALFPAMRIDRHRTKIGSVPWDAVAVLPGYLAARWARHVAGGAGPGPQPEPDEGDDEGAPDE